MKQNKKKHFWTGIWFLLAFLLWTALIRCVDVQAAGPNGTKVGFAAFNLWFHHLTGVHMSVYTITDWLGLVPIAVCLGFGVVGVFQLIRRKSLIRVDPDIILLGLYYILVVLGYLVFEMIPINYRPILIGGALEASYPSSTTLLVLSVMPTLVFQVGRRCEMPTLVFQVNRRCERKTVKRTVSIFVVLFSAFMVIGRSVSGVHWATDIVGSVLLSFGLFKLYQSAVTTVDLRNKNGVQ